ncbi:mucin-4 [Bubalus kerabau]|uniref:mucin-4 n=1 Tax=Bubalus carabanensis TaxID=3119969 RepID=UPI00244E89D6|nr:mucin-4 [Bubalus carabanensis]
MSQAGEDVQSKERPWPLGVLERGRQIRKRQNNLFSLIWCESHACNKIKNVDSTNLNRQNILPIKCKQYISNDISIFSEPPDSEHENHQRNTNHHHHSCENINCLIIDTCTQIYRRHFPEDISFRYNNHFIPTPYEVYTYGNIKNMENKVLSRHHCRKPKEHITNSTETYPSSVSDKWTRETINLTPFHHFYWENISIFSEPPDSEHENHQRNTNHHHHSCENNNSLIIDTCTQIYRRHFPEDISFRYNNHFIPTLCEAYTYSNIKNMENKNLSRHHCRKPEEHITNSTETHASSLHSVNDNWTRETINLTLFHHFGWENINVSSEPPDSEHENHQGNTNDHHHSCENINCLIIDTCTQIYRRHFPEDISFRYNNHFIPTPYEVYTYTPGPAVTWSSTTRFTSHPTPLSVTSTSPTVTGSTMKAETSGKITTSQRADHGGSTASLPSTTSQTLTTSTPGTSTGTHSTAASVPVNPGKGVLLFPYGPSAGDWEFVRRTVDFTSPLFKPQIGFPLGSLLWDSLYFTDNGQIIFPKSDYEIFSYPNPPLRGFSDWDSVAMVAPFWDDADFSSSRGTIFYQEYETLYDDYNTLVQKVESSIKMLTKTGNYKARWTLKITWVHVPAYPARVTIGTNTYQAILSTDGSRSYALFLYQSGGMQWNVTGRPGNSVLMGFASGDGYFKNSQLTFHPVWEKYRPDQFLDSNSGLRGLQIYKLHREEKPSYRLRCLQWLKRQPQWPSWGWNQISCPCSWNQGVLDLRFQSISLRVSGLVAGSRQLCSFSSWRGGVCCRYGPWGELLQGWRVQSPWQLDQELELQNWCCHFNSKPSFCALYQLRRPPVSCAGYQPSSLAWMVGDPHITTLDGVNYTFNGLGDFLLVRTQDRNSSFLLQGRTAQTHSANATNFIGFAAEYRSSSLHPITVQWLLKPNNTIHVQLNNQTIAFETNGEDTKDQEIFNSSGVIMTHYGSTISASFDGAVAISVLAISNILHISCSLSKGYQNHTEGLMGFWNGNPDDDFRMPNGSTIPKKSSEEMLFHYGMTWKINGTSLFGKRDDHLLSSFTPVFLSQLLRNTSLNKNLTSSCHGDDQCIFDVLATGSEKLGNDTRAIFRIYQQMNTTLNQYPPSIKGPDVIKAYMGQTTVVNYTSDAKGITFTLRENCTDFKLFENGTLLWTPKLLEPFTLEILASSDQGSLSSVLKPRTVVCECKAESQRLYNQTSWVSNSSLEAADCKCDGNTFGRYCNYSKDPCDEQCFPNVKCISGKGCEACPPHLTGDGRHCASLEKPFLCQNKACPEDYCYNNGFCSVSHTLGCQPVCTCPSAFTDARCFLAGNNFTPTVHQELPLRIIQLSLTEDENASQADVNASVAYRLKNLELWAFLWNRQVDQTKPSTAPASGSSLHHWNIISEFQYRPEGPVIDFLNNRLLDAVVKAFLPPAPQMRAKRSGGPRNNVAFHSISRKDVNSLMALNVSMLATYLQCNGYKDYHLVYSPQGGFTCVSPCSQGYCKHGGQCQHLPDGPRCSCVHSSIYTPWGKRCEQLSLKLGAFFGILFGTLGAILLLGVAVFVILRFWCSWARFSYRLDS